MIQNNSKGQLTAQVNLGDNVRSGFRFDYANRGSGRLGRIYPIRSQHVYPSDKVRSNSIAALQFEPLAVPILANMYVHQEHFYVPENTLWEDFDKFISGGQKMDYQGKKPSKSLKAMWESFFWFLTEDEEEFFFNSVQLLKKSSTEVVITSASIGEMEDFVMPFRHILERMQMLDLFDHVEDAVRSCGAYLSSVMQDGEVKLFTKGYGLSAGNVYEGDFSLYYNSLQPNKYLRKISESIKKVFDMAGLDYIIPTTEGMQFLNYLYEIFKPFFGLGSNLDMLGYNKLTFDNFVYLFMTCFTLPPILGNNNLDSFAIYLDQFLSKMSVYMSDYPQDILKLRAQYSVWWNNYRDQLLEMDAFEPAITTEITDKEIVVLLAPRIRCWHKDTFTTALDNPGTGNIGVPVGTQVPSQGTYSIFTQTVNGSNDANVDASNVYKIEIDGKSWNIPTPFLSGINSKVEEEDSSYQGFSLYQLDAARRAQKWLQRALFYGNRIQDFLYTHFGVKYLDARLRLPELLATSKNLVRLTDVINNTNIKSNDGTLAVAGDRAAVAHAYDDNGGSFERYIEEWGYIISNLTVMPDVTYANGFDRDLAMLDQFDYPFPAFATLGMDAVYDIEMAQLPVRVSVSGDTSEMSAEPSVFGYQGRYYTVKSKLGEEHGELLDTQDMYTFARDFNIYDPDGRPKLNYIFVHCHPSLDMFVVNNKFSDYFRFDIYFNSGADRAYPAHSLVI